MRGPLLAVFALFAFASAAGALPPTQLVQGDDDVARALSDPDWPRRAAAFLETQHGVSQSDWTLLSDTRKRELARDWARQRGDALKARRDLMLQGRPPTEDQARQMRLLAENGFLDPAELRGVEKLRTAGGSALLEAAAIQPSAAPGAMRADAARQFRQDPYGSRAPVLRAPAQAAADGRAPTTQADLEVTYRTAQQMVMDPEAFAKTHPELAKDMTDGEREKQGRLRQQLGHLFATANRLRAQDRLEFRLGSDKEMDGSFGETEIEDVRGGGWKIVVRLHEKYKNADPALLAPTMIHELQHVHNDARRIERHGLAVARRLDDFQEEEERAFIAESRLAPAYASTLRLAKAPDPAHDATLHEQVAMLDALENARSGDELRYRACLKDAAVSLLRRNSYLEGEDALRTLTALRRKAERKKDRELLRLIDEERSRGIDIL